MASNRIPGVSKSSLWRAWKSVRRQLRESSVRDVIDFLEYDIDPEVWIKRLLDQIDNFRYEPAQPSRFLLAKSNGFTRTMTMPSIPDLTLYRALVDYFYKRLRRHEVKHAYFERAAIDAAQRRAFIEARLAMADEPQYPLLRPKRFLAWLKLDEYRRQLILGRVYSHIVTVDVSNYFDTILHSRLVESLQKAGADPETVGLLFFLIEKLAVRREYTDSPRIGLPVDEFDCSRKLAHIFLFPHDRRMLAEVGEEAYIRWMDDQTIGVDSRARALRVLGCVSASLARLYLTPNTSKCRILSLREANAHFHLDTNAAFRAVEDSLGSGNVDDVARDQFRESWHAAIESEGRGEWEKILKWGYRLAGRLGVSEFRSRAASDVLTHPRLARRIADYVRTTGTAAEFVDFAEQLWQHEEQVYPDVNLAVFESFLRLEPEGATRKRIRDLAGDVLRGRTKLSGLMASASIAPLAILRFGDRRSLPILERCFTKKPERLAVETIRSAAVVYASYGAKEFETVKSTAARILRHTLTDLVRFVDRVLEYNAVPDRFKARFSPRLDTVGGTKYFDMRSVVALRLLALSPAAKVVKWVGEKKSELLNSEISEFDKQMILRLIG